MLFAPGKWLPALVTILDSFTVMPQLCVVSYVQVTELVGGEDQQPHAGCFEKSIPSLAAYKCLDAVVKDRYGPTIHD